MNTRDVQRLISTSNPVRDTDFGAAERTPQARATWLAILDDRDAPVQAAVIDLPGDSRPFASTLSSPRRAFLPVLAGLVVIAVAVVTTLAVSTHRHRGHRATAVHPTITASAYVRQLVRQVPLPPGTHRTARVTLPSSFVLPRPTSTDLAATTAYWTSTARGNGVRAFLRGHLPPHWTLPAVVTASGNPGTDELDTILVSDPTSRFAGEISLRVTTSGATTSISGVVQIRLMPIRSAAQVIRQTKTATVIEDTPASAPRSLTQDQIDQLLPLINHLPVASPFVVAGKCAPSLAATGATIAFGAGNDRITVTLSGVTRPPCGPPAVLRSSTGATIALAVNNANYSRITRILELPH